MAEEDQPRHVIILGAGASSTSGYPLADTLRLLMSSEKAVQRELEKQGISDTDYAEKVIREMMGGPIKPTIDLFRRGGFATVDEFSKLAGLRFPNEVQALKRLLRFVLALRDPEEEFHKSDYYRFIQRLFHKGLFPLRTDVAILTFNYDPYLPYLADRAYMTRCQAAGASGWAAGDAPLTSGFLTRAVGSLEDGTSLCVLLLHGSIAWPRKRVGENVIAYDDLFGSSAQERLEKLCFSQAAASQPPLIFPWEILDDKRSFLSELDFCLREQMGIFQHRQGGYDGHITLHQLFMAIWKRARKEINRATKISFVGLSMHDFLDPAFEFLFAERKANAAIVCVNRDHRNFRSQDDVEAHTSARSPTFKLRRLLKRICPAITGVPNRGERQVWLDGGATVRVRETFEEFIQNEMD